MINHSGGGGRVGWPQQKGMGGGWGVTAQLIHPVVTVDVSAS